MLNHSNSNKKYKEQLRIVSEVLHTRRYNPDLKNMIKGVIWWKVIWKKEDRISDLIWYMESPFLVCTLYWLGRYGKHLIYKIAEEC